MTSVSPKKFFMGGILKEKYGGWRGLLKEESLRGASIWWRDLRKVFRGENQMEWFNSLVEWKVGEGDIFSFWRDSLIITSI